MEPKINPKEVDARQEGWNDGYNDREFNCPYPEGTPEFDDYCDGFDAGRWNH